MKCNKAKQNDKDEINGNNKNKNKDDYDDYIDINNEDNNKSIVHNINRNNEQQ